MPMLVLRHRQLKCVLQWNPPSCVRIKRKLSVHMIIAEILCQSIATINNNKLPINSLIKHSMPYIYTSALSVACPYFIKYCVNSSDNL